MAPNGTPTATNVFVVIDSAVARPDVLRAAIDAGFRVLVLEPLEDGLTQIASALHGVARATMDSDIITDFREEHVEPFVQALKSTFYVDDEMIREAVRHQRSFNIIHLQTFF